MTPPLRRLFQETSLDDLCAQQQICILKDTATVEQALKVGQPQQCDGALVLWAGAAVVDSLAGGLELGVITACSFATMHPWSLMGPCLPMIVCNR